MTKSVRIRGVVADVKPRETTDPEPRFDVLFVPSKGPQAGQPVATYTQRGCEWAYVAMNFAQKPAELYFDLQGHVVWGRLLEAHEVN